MTNKIYSTFHLKFIENIIFNKRVEMANLIKKNINIKFLKSICDVGTTEDKDNKSSNYLIKTFKEIEIKNSISDQLIEDSFFDNKVQASITDDMKSKNVDLIKSDILISSATIEHVGSRGNQEKMISNMINLSNKYIVVTTPNKFHPIEFHTKLPLLHFLPDNIYRKILTLLGYSFFAQEKNLNLLSLKDFEDILNKFTNINFKIFKVKFFGFTSNLVAICEKKNY